MKDFVATWCFILQPMTVLQYTDGSGLGLDDNKSDLDRIQEGHTQMSFNWFMFS